MALYGPGGLMKFRWDPNLTYEEKLKIHERLMRDNAEYSVRAPAFTEAEKRLKAEDKEAARAFQETVRKYTGRG